MYIIRDYSRIVDRKPNIIKGSLEVVRDFIDCASFEGEGTHGRIWMTQKHEYHVTATRKAERDIVDAL